MVKSELKIGDVIEIYYCNCYFLGEILGFNTISPWPVICLTPKDMGFQYKDKEDENLECLKPFVQSLDQVKTISHGFSAFSEQEIIGKTELTW